MWFRNLLCRRADIHWKSQELPKWGIFGNRQPGPAGLTISLAGGQAGVSTTGSRVNSDSRFVAIAVQSLSCVRLFATPWTAARQASLSITNSRSLPKLMSTESAMPSNHLILCRPLLLPPSLFPSIRVFLKHPVFPLGRHQSLLHVPNSDKLLFFFSPSTGVNSF